MSDSKTSISLSKISKLRHSTSWKKWKRAIKQWLMDQDLDLPAPISLPIPAGIRTAAQTAAHALLLSTYNEELRVWQRRQLRGVNSMASTCATKGANLIEGKAATCAEALRVLEANFKLDDDSTFSGAYNKWTPLCLASCVDVDDYVEEFEDIYSDLQDLNPDYSLPDVEIVLKFINGLGSGFTQWRQSFDMNYNVSTTTLTIAQALARKEEQRQQQEGSAMALAARTTAPATNATSLSSSLLNSNSRKTYPPCSGCGENWHPSEKCWVTYPELEAKWRLANPDKAAVRDLRKARALRKKESKPSSSSTSTKKRSRSDSTSSAEEEATKRPRFAGLAHRTTI